MSKPTENKCIARVSRRIGSWSHPGKCDRPAGHGPGGQYCWQHDPEKVKAKAAMQEEKYQKERKFNLKKWASIKLFPKALKLCRLILSEQYVDARDLAREILRNYRKEMKR